MASLDDGLDVRVAQDGQRPAQRGGQLGGDPLGVRGLGEPGTEPVADADGAQPGADDVGGEEVLADEFTETLTELVLLGRNDGGVRDGQAHRVTEERGDREPVGERADHARLGRRRDVARPAAGTRVARPLDQDEDGGHQQQRTGGDGLHPPHPAPPLLVGRREPTQAAGTAVAAGTTGGASRTTRAAARARPTGRPAPIAPFRSDRPFRPFGPVRPPGDAARSAQRSAIPSPGPTETGTTVCDRPHVGILTSRQLALVCPFHPLPPSPWTPPEPPVPQRSPGRKRQVSQVHSPKCHIHPERPSPFSPVPLAGRRVERTPPLSRLSVRALRNAARHQPVCRAAPRTMRPFPRAAPGGGRAPIVGSWHRRPFGACGSVSPRRHTARDQEHGLCPARRIGGDRGPRLDRDIHRGRRQRQRPGGRFLPGA